MRSTGVVRFVCFEEPLETIIGISPTGGVGEEAGLTGMSRQSAVDAIRDELERLSAPVRGERCHVLHYCVATRSITTPCAGT